MKKLILSVLLFSSVFFCLSAHPMHGFHSGPRPFHHHGYGHSLHTRDWVALGISLLGSTIIARSIETSPVYVVPQTTTSVVVPSIHTVTVSPAPVVVTPQPTVVYSQPSPVVVAPPLPSPYIVRPPVYHRPYRPYPYYSRPLPPLPPRFSAPPFR